MIPAAHDRDVAAVLAVAVEIGALSVAEVVARIDAEITSREDPPQWLIDGSMASTADGLLHVLQAAAGAHPVLQQPLASLDAVAVLRERRPVSTDKAVRFILDLYYTGCLPADLHELARDVYEDGFCGHAHADGPQPALAERALSTFLAAVRDRSDSVGAIRRVAAEGWV